MRVNLLKKTLLKFVFALFIFVVLGCPSPSAGEETYTVTYLGNGAIEGSAPYDSNSYIFGSQVKIFGNINGLRNEGFVFAGWSTVPDGSGITYSANQVITMPNHHLTLYAIWAAETYTITYDANGSDSGSVPVDTNRYVSYTTGIILGNAGNLIKGGFTFVGWNTKADGSGDTYIAGRSIIIHENNITLYAKWSTETFSVTYFSNGSSTGTAPIDNNAYVSGQEVTVLGKNDLRFYSSTGIVFCGWNTKADGTGLRYKPGATITVGSTDISLYAEWGQGYSLKYHENDGADNQESGVSYYPEGEVYTVWDLTYLGRFEKEGYKFQCWNTSPDGNGVDYNPGSTLTLGTQNVILYAKWVKDGGIFSYHENGGVRGSFWYPPKHFAGGTSFNILYDNNSFGLTRDGYNFVCWNTKADGNGQDYYKNDSFVMPDSDVTLYAKWSLIQVQTYSVFYNRNGADSGSVPVDSISYQFNENATILGNTGSLVKAGYIFKCWSFNGANYNPGDLLRITNSDVTLTAVWEKAFIVTYNSNGASSGIVPIDANEYVNGGGVTLLDNSGNLVKPGYRFVGWSTNINGSNNIKPGELAYINNANLTLYASWAKEYTITYHSNGATSGNVPVDTNKYIEGERVTRANNPGNLTQTGFRFVGWNSQPDGSGVTYLPNFNMSASNKDMYAEWKQLYPVTYSSTGHDSGSVPVENNLYVAGEAHHILDNPGNLVKSGHYLAGWNAIGANGSFSTYKPGDRYYDFVDRPTLTASWKPNIKITYNGNGDSQGTVKTDLNNYRSSNHYKPSGYVEPVAWDAFGLRNPGQVFECWNTRADGTGVSYNPGDQITNLATDLTLYAIWKYNVGTPGPAGGTIVYDRGIGSSGWRFIEAAPADLGSYIWGSNDISGASSASLGQGRSNTYSIINGHTSTNNAAYACASYTTTVSGQLFDDWFLPSKDELLEVSKVITLSPSVYYWCSTQTSGSSAYHLNQYGSFGFMSKNGAASVRPIRMF